MKPNFRANLAIIVASFFLASQLTIPRLSFAKNTRSTDPYAKYTNDQLLDMALKDYQIALAIAIDSGAIKDEAELFQIISKADQTPPMTKKQRAALKKRGIDPRPSKFIGKTRAKEIQEAFGVDIDKVDHRKATGAGVFLPRSLKYNDPQKIEIKTKPRKFSLESLKEFLLGLLSVKNAYAQRGGRNNGRAGGGSQVPGSTDRRNSSGGRVVTGSGLPTSPYGQGPSDQYINDMQNLYNQPSVADAWDKADASRKKGYKNFDKQIRKKKNLAMLLLIAGALLIMLGIKNVSDGEKMLNDRCATAAKTPDSDSAKSRAQEKIAADNRATAERLDTKISDSKAELDVYGTKMETYPQESAFMGEGGKTLDQQKYDTAVSSWEKENPGFTPSGYEGAKLEHNNLLQIRGDGLHHYNHKPIMQPKVQNDGFDFNNIKEFFLSLVTIKSAHAFLGGGSKGGNTIGSSGQCSPPNMQISPKTGGYNPQYNPNCDGACMFTRNDPPGNQKKQTGYIMILIGAGLLLYGMTVLGQAAELEDEKAEQDRKNADIDRARQKLQNREQKKQDQQRKIIEYRERQRQRNEQNNQNQRDTLNRIR